MRSPGLGCLGLLLPWLAVGSPCASAGAPSNERASPATPVPPDTEADEPDVGGTDQHALERELFADCKPELLTDSLTNYNCTGFNAMLGEDKGTTVEASRSAAQAGIRKAIDPGTDFTTSELAVTVSGERVAGVTMHAKFASGRPSTDFNMLFFERGDGVRFAQCMHNTGDDARAEKCRRVLEFFVQFGWPNLGAAVDKRVTGDPEVRGKRLAVPAGCRSELDDFGGRILCSASELRWGNVEDVSNAGVILEETAKSYRSATHGTAIEYPVTCEVLSQKAECVGLKTEAGGGQRLIVAVSPGPQAPLFVSCAFKGASGLPEMCRQLLTATE